jgi:tetratricopeptide (TPR) repeat protein
LSGDYARGVKILSELFVETEDEVFIYNQGRCFEQNRRWEDAIARFEEYLRVGKKLSKTHKAGALNHIADCQRHLAKQASQAASGAAASTAESKDAKERAARKACLTGDPVAGVAILTDLFLDTKDPTHLFNQGRCFEQNRRYEDAVGRFREYLEKAKNLNEEDKADTRRHIANCEAYSAHKPADAKGDEHVKTPVRESHDVDAKPSDGLKDATTIATAPSAEKPRGRGLRLAGGVLAGLGVAGIATGIALNLKVNSMSSDLEANWRSPDESTRRSYKAAGWIAYGSGAGCVAAGAILYYIGWLRGQAAAPIALVPVFGAEMAGASLSGAF